MNYLDIILLIVLAFFLFKGARVGFVRLLGGFVGIVVGAYLAGTYYNDLAEIILENFDINLMLAIVIAFIAIYVIVNVIIGVVVDVLARIFKYIPLATFTNRIVGAALGLLQGMLLVGLIIWIITLFPFQGRFAETVQESQIAHYFEYTTQLVQPLLPSSLRDLDFTMLQDLQNFTEEKADYLRENMPKFFNRVEEQRDDLQQQYDEAIERYDEDSP